MASKTKTNSPSPPSQAEINQLTQRLFATAGFRQSSQQSSRLYTSIPLTGLDKLPARRNTEKRADFLQIPKKLDGERVLDFGCHIGAFSFLCAKRGAIVFGYDVNAERVRLAQDIANAYNLPCTFFHIDLTQPIDQQIKANDRVLALSVDHYLSNPFSFYSALGRARVIHLESNRRNSSELAGILAELMTGRVQVIGNKKETNRTRTAYLIDHKTADDLAVQFVAFSKIRPHRINRYNRQWVEYLITKINRGETLQPILLNRNLQVIDGVHRYNAYRLAGYGAVPCIVLDVSESEGRLLEQSELRLKKFNQQTKGRYSSNLGGGILPMLLKTGIT